MWQEQLQSGEIEEEDIDNAAPDFTLYPDSPEPDTSLLYHTSDKGLDDDPDETDTGYTTENVETDVITSSLDASLHSDVRKDEEEQQMLQTLKGELQASDEDEINILVQSENRSAANPKEPSENARLISSCRDFKTHPKSALFQRMISVPDSMPQSQSFTKSCNITSPLLIRQRSHTQGSVYINRPLFQRQVSCPSHKCRRKEINARIKMKEREQELERERASLSMTESQMDLVPDDFVSVDMMPDHQDEQDPLLASYTSRDFTDLKTKEDATLELIDDKQRHNTQDLV